MSHQNRRSEQSAQACSQSKPVGQISDFDLATEEYEQIVSLCAEHDIAVEISNRHIAHAAVLTRHILKNTEGDIDILTGVMPELFFDRIKHEFIAALNRQVTVRVLTIDPVAPTCELRSMRAKYPNLKLFQIDAAHRREVKLGVPHFCVSDRRRYRLEEIHPDKDFSKDPAVKAVACFGHVDGARKLHSTFQQLLEFSEAVN